MGNYLNVIEKRKSELMNRLQIIVIAVVIAVAAAVPLAWRFLTKPPEELNGIPVYPGARVGVPGEAPSGLPRYPGAITTAEYYTMDLADQVSSWYRSEMNRRGWALIWETEVVKLACLLVYVKGDEGLFIVVESRDAMGAKITLTHGPRIWIEQAISMWKKYLPTPPPISVSLALDNAYAGSSGLLLMHYGGDLIENALRGGSWGEMEVRINGRAVTGTTLVLNGVVLVGDAGFWVGDVLKLDGGYTLAQGDLITVIYNPTKQVLFETRV